MRRREFIARLGSTTVAWPLAARTQQSDRTRRIGVLIPLAADDPQAKARTAELAQGLQQLGWTEVRNVQIDTRRSAGDPEAARRYSISDARRY